jgi:hypothetical protein
VSKHTRVIENEKRLLAIHGTPAMPESNINFVCERLNFYAGGSSCPEATRQIIEGLIKLLVLTAKANKWSPLDKATSDFYTVLNSVNRVADELIDGANRAVDEISEELEALQKAGTLHGIPDLNLQLEQIQEELDRRAAWSEAISPIQEEMENQREPIKLDIERIEQIIKHQATEDLDGMRRDAKNLKQIVSRMDEAIAEVMTHIDANIREVEKLRQFQQALVLLRDGLPQDLIGKQLLNVQVVQNKIPQQSS